MKFRHAAVALGLLASASAFAASGCTKTFDLGAMGPPADRAFSSGYFAAGNFQDCYDFSINAGASATGTTTEWNWNFSNLLGYIDVLTVQLFSTSGARTAIGSPDTTPEAFSFSNLAAGAYELVVSGTTMSGMMTTLVSYTGELHTRSASTTTVAAPVPEPALMLLMAMGLGGAGLAARRRARQR